MGGGVKFHFDNFELEFSHVLREVIVIANMGVGEPGSASVTELVLWNVVWKSLMKSGKVPKEELSKAPWVQTAAQLLAVSSVMKERAYLTFLLSVE